MTKIWFLRGFLRGSILALVILAGIAIYLGLVPGAAQIGRILLSLLFCGLLAWWIEERAARKAEDDAVRRHFRRL